MGTVSQVNASIFVCWSLLLEVPRAVPIILLNYFLKGILWYFHDVTKAPPPAVHPTRMSFVQCDDGFLINTRLA